jgi:hypothetical protein
MKLTNDSYVISMGTKNFTEYYYRETRGWVKISARGRKFPMTAEQVLNHLLPAIAGVKPNLILKVEHREKPSANPKGVASLSPGLRREAGRYPGKNAR